MTVELLFFFAPQVSFSCGWEDQYNCKAYYYVLLCPDARRKYREESLWQVWRRADRTGYLYSRGTQVEMMRGHKIFFQ